MDCIYSATYIPALLTYFSRLVSNAAAVVSPKCNPQDFFHQHWTFLHQPIASDDGGRTQGQEEPGGTSDSSVHSSTVSSSQITVEVALKFFQSTLKPDFAFSSVQFSHSVMSDSLRPRELQLARPPCPSPYPGVHSNSCPSSWWCHPTISSSVVPLSSCPQSLPASESFPMSQLFTWGGQSIGVSALASFLPKKSQDWSPLEWSGWISLQSKGLSRVFSNTTVQKHQFFGTQPSSQSNSHIHAWPLEKP